MRSGVKYGRPLPTSSRYSMQPLLLLLLLQSWPHLLQSWAQPTFTPMHTWTTGTRSPLSCSSWFAGRSRRTRVRAPSRRTWGNSAACSARASRTLTSCFALCVALCRPRFWKQQWVTDCKWKAVDGINESGAAASYTCSGNNGSAAVELSICSFTHTHTHPLSLHRQEQQTPFPSSFPLPPINFC